LINQKTIGAPSGSIKKGENKTDAKKEKPDTEP
jgi:hypothetical protein